MSKLIDCRALRPKMSAYFSASLSKRNGAEPIKGRAQLADFLNVNKSQITRWLDGSERVAPDRLPEEQLRKLAEQVFILSGQRITPEEAWSLWVDRTAEEFERKLRQQDLPDPVKFLARKAPSLTVRLGPPDNTLGMFDEPFEPLPEEEVLEVGTSVRIETEMTPRKCLILIGCSPIDWFWISPSNWHSGVSATKKAVVPPKSGFPLNTTGPHRIIAIELDTQTPPFYRDRGVPMSLTHMMRHALAEEIVACDTRSGWRWGEHRFFVEAKINRAS